MDNDQFLLLVTKHLTGNIQPEEARLLQKITEENNYYKERFALLKEYFHQNKQTNQVPRQAFENVLNRINTNSEIPSVKGRQISLKHKVIVALSAAAMLAALFFGIKMIRKTSSVNNTSSSLSWVQKQNGTGRKSYLVLEDGTKIWLNENSRLVYNDDFGKNKREIQLTGEAFFDVAHNARVPLVIHARNIDIKVKGTAFNVSAYDENGFVETTLIRGLVEVVNRADEGRTIMLKPNEKLIIPATAQSSQMPGDSQNITGSTDLQKPYSIEPVHKEPKTALVPELSWMDNKLVFYHETFERISERMERRYKAKFHFKDTAIMQQQFTGSFEKETLEQALTALQYSYYFKYTISGEQVFISKK